MFIIMKSSKPSMKITTVSVDGIVRDEINKEADRLGVSQREMVSRLLETYMLKNPVSNSEDKEVDESILAKILESLEKVLKRDDRVVAFIKEQEKILLKPILQGVQANDAQLNQLIDILSNLE